MLWSHTYTASVIIILYSSVSCQYWWGGGAALFPPIFLPLFATRPLSLHTPRPTFPICLHSLYHRMCRLCVLVYLCHKLVPICICDTQNVSIPPHPLSFFCIPLHFALSTSCFSSLCILLHSLFPSPHCIPRYSVSFFTFHPSSHCIHLHTVSLFTLYTLSLCIHLRTPSGFTV